MKAEPKRVIITGATDGLGLRLAWLFAAQNADLLLTGRKNKNELKYPLPENAHYIAADQSHLVCCDIIKTEIDRLGWNHVDHLVLNAGTGHTVDPIRERPQSIQNVMTVNLITPVNLVHNLAPLFIMKNSASSPGIPTLVTFIGSTSAKGAADFASYAASKAGITGFVRALASEWQNRVDVQIIHPGPTRTRMHEKAGMNIGFAKNFFVDPDYSASRIMNLVHARKPVATIGMAKYAVHRLLAKSGMITKPTRALPQ